MSDSGRTAHDGSTGPSRRMAIAIDQRRVVERVGHVGRTAMIVASLVLAVLLGTAIFRDAWALLPIGALAVALPLGPAIINRTGHPEYAELTFSLLVTIAMATAAALTGGTSSPIVFLLPIGVVMNALRAGRTSIVVCSAVTMIVFIAVCLLDDPSPVLHEPLPMLAILAMQLAVTIASLALAEAELGHRQASTIDPLTGLLNRQGLLERFEEIRRQALVSSAPVTLVLFDLDLFKRVNDVHGHETGDRLLREVADEARTRLRKFELIYRIGGEEFLVLLPDTSEWEGEDVAEQLRLGVISVGMRMRINITASFGVSSGSDAEVDFAELFRRADAALYRAKREGRDRVAASGPLALTSTHRARGSRVSRVSA
jgi:diguanylate cyclase (GGDEF)-like protein